MGCGKTNPHTHKSVGDASIPLPDLSAYEPRAINQCLHVDHAQPWACEGKSRGLTLLRSMVWQIVGCTHDLGMEGCCTRRYPVQ